MIDAEKKDQDAYPKKKERPVKKGLKKYKDKMMLNYKNKRIGG